MVEKNRRARLRFFANKNNAAAVKNSKPTVYSAPINNSKPAADKTVVVLVSEVALASNKTEKQNKN